MCVFFSLPNQAALTSDSSGISHGGRLGLLSVHIRAVWPTANLLKNVGPLWGLIILKTPCLSSQSQHKNLLSKICIRSIDIDKDVSTFEGLVKWPKSGHVYTNSLGYEAYYRTFWDEPFIQTFPVFHAPNSWSVLGLKMCSFSILIDLPPQVLLEASLCSWINIMWNDKRVSPNKTRQKE